jgi:TRAP-type C4-dicarboxylate transport system permease small subunit
MEPTRLHQWLSAHAPLCFLLMVACFLLFGWLSLDLVRQVSANAGLLVSHGREALADGGLQQALELALNALAAVAAWLMFKLCEQVLVQRLAFRRRP